MDDKAPNHNDQYELNTLLDRRLAGKIWRGQKQKKQSHKTSKLSSGYQLLDAQLYDSGWPLTTITEIGLSQHGIGELRLLTPALRELQNRQTKLGQAGNLIWVAPPLIPFAPALIRERINIEQLIIVQTNTIQDTLWATEQALLSDSCIAVFSWTGRYNLSNRELRRLQLAAGKSNKWNVLIRHSDCLKQASPCGLRLHLKSNTYSKLEIDILKQPQGWGGQHCSLSLQPHYENWQRLPVNLLPHHNVPRTYEEAHGKVRIDSQTKYKVEQLNDSYNTEQRQASVTVLSSLAKLQTVH